MKLYLLILILIPTFVLANTGAKVNINRHPSKHEISVKVDQDAVARVKIYTDSDKLVWSEERYDTEFKIDFTFFPPGVYNVQILVNGKVEKYSFRKK